MSCFAWSPTASGPGVCHPEHRQRQEHPGSRAEPHTEVRPPAAVGRPHVPPVPQHRSHADRLREGNTRLSARVCKEGLGETDVC